MHREIGTAIAHRLLELLDEESFAADIGQRLIDNAIALRRQTQQRYLTRRIESAETMRDQPRLPHREGRFAGGDGEFSE